MQVGKATDSYTLAFYVRFLNNVAFIMGLTQLATSSGDLRTDGLVKWLNRLLKQGCTKREVQVGSMLRSKTFGLPDSFTSIPWTIFILLNSMAGMLPYEFAPAINCPTIAI